MSDYTPTTDDVRGTYADGMWYVNRRMDGTLSEFDRWLAAHDAEVRASVVSEEPEWEYGIRAEGDEEPYTDHSDDPDWLCDQITPEPGDAIVRRRKARPWEVIPDA